MDPYTFVQSKEKTCPHGIAVRFDCYQCAFDQVKKSQSGVCSHWIPKSQPCYACDRQTYRENPFTERPHIPIVNKPVNNVPQNKEFIQQQMNSEQGFFSNQMLPNMEGYTHPDNPNKQYNQPQPERHEFMNNNVPVGGGRYQPSEDPRRSMSIGRSQTRRSSNENPSFGFSMDRYLEESKFMDSQQGNMWGNPLIKKNFQHKNDYDMDAMMNKGMGTRTSRKIDSAGRNENIFLNRSMVQPDMRQGNRFYEIMPQTDRMSSMRREADNQMAEKFQQQSASIYSEMDYKKAFDTGASVGRGGQARWEPM